MRISSAAHHELTKLGVRVMTKTMVTSADEGGLNTKEGEHIDADLMVWAAGIKAPDFMKDIAGLETNRINQLVVNQPYKRPSMSLFLLSVIAHLALEKKVVLFHQGHNQHIKWQAVVTAIF